MEAAKKILACYPDYGKAPPEYLLAVTELLSGYDDYVLTELSDLRRGVVARCAFLPTIADIVKMAGEVLAARPRAPATAPPEPRITMSMDDYHAIQFYPQSPEAEAARERLRAQRSAAGLVVVK